MGKEALLTVCLPWVAFSAEPPNNALVAQKVTPL